MSLSMIIIRQLQMYYNDEEYMNNYTWKSVAKRIIKHFLSE